LRSSAARKVTVASGQPAFVPRNAIAKPSNARMRKPPWSCTAVALDNSCPTLTWRRAANPGSWYSISAIATTTPINPISAARRAVSE